jgi:hypothetical protein
VPSDNTPQRRENSRGVMDSMGRPLADPSQDAFLIRVPGVGDLIAKQSCVGDTAVSPPVAIKRRSEHEGMYWVLTAFVRPGAWHIVGSLPSQPRHYRRADKNVGRSPYAMISTSRQ